MLEVAKMVTSISNGTDVFTFEDAMINKISSSVGTEIDENVMPGTGPKGNFGIDINGVTKVITVDGQLIDTTSSVLGATNNKLQSMEVMKLWLEALHNGNQNVVQFISHREKFSVLSSGSATTITDSVSGEEITLRANFGTSDLDGHIGTTYVYVKGMSFDDEEGKPNEIPFSMTLWVAGQ